MGVMMRLGDFVANAILPKGLKFRDWGDGVLVKPGFSDSGYISTKICAIERISDGAYSTIEITSLSRIDTHVNMDAEKFSQAVNKVIEELSRTEETCQTTAQ